MLAAASTRFAAQYFRLRRTGDEMSRGPWGNWEKSERRGYQHGRLNEALIEAARSLVARHGPAGFTLAEAAKLVGVTPAAPYRHFSDRDELMGEVARQGFDKFRGRLLAAWDEGRPEPSEALKRMGRAYLAFAREEPGYYFTMFGHAQKLANGGGHEAAQRAFATLEEAAARVLKQRHASPQAARKLAYEIWSLSHGVATLMLGRHLEAGRAECDPETILESGVAAMVEQAVWTARQT